MSVQLNFESFDHMWADVSVMCLNRWLNIMMDDMRSPQKVRLQHLDRLLLVGSCTLLFPLHDIKSGAKPKTQSMPSINPNPDSAAQQSDRNCSAENNQMQVKACRPSLLTSVVEVCLSARAAVFMFYTSSFNVFHVNFLCVSHVLPVRVLVLKFFFFFVKRESYIFFSFK